MTTLPDDIRPKGRWLLRCTGFQGRYSTGVFTKGQPYGMVEFDDPPWRKVFFTYLPLTPMGAHRAKVNGLPMPGADDKWGTMSVHRATPIGRTFWCEVRVVEHPPDSEQFFNEIRSMEPTETAKTALVVLQNFLRQHNAGAKEFAALTAMLRGEGEMELRFPVQGDSIFKEGRRP